nr:hypothetical protein BaRGS_024417 [Batillaria attramentaria]
MPVEDAAAVDGCWIPAWVTTELRDKDNRTDGQHKNAEKARRHLRVLIALAAFFCRMWNGSLGDHWTEGWTAGWVDNTRLKREATSEGMWDRRLDNHWTEGVQDGLGHATGVPLDIGCTAEVPLDMGCTTGVRLGMGCTAGVPLDMGCTAGVPLDIGHATGVPQDNAHATGAPPDISHGWCCCRTGDDAMTKV